MTLLEELEELTYSFDGRENMREIMARQPRWVSVEDRLPEGTCLVYMEDRNDRNRFEVGVYHKNINVIGNNFEFDMPKVTHWMSLPEPPK